MSAWSTAIVALLLGVSCGSDRRATLDVDVSGQEGLPAIARIDLWLTAGEQSSGATLAAAPGAALELPATIAIRVTGLPRGPAELDVQAFDANLSLVARVKTSARLPPTMAVPVVLKCDSAGCPTGQDAAVDAGPSDGGPDAPAADAPRETSTTCGNGRIDPGELCDTAISSGQGACPTSCNDDIGCTRDFREGDGCQAHCSHEEITATMSGDGCCPSGATSTTDSDCSAACGNGKIEVGETCDTGLVDVPGACPTAGSCDDADPCTTDQLVSANTCSARCLHKAIGEAPGDGCCPAGADATTDSDCQPACGNGVVEPGERCDPGIDLASGLVCPTAFDCDDGDPCTRDVLMGEGCNVYCEHTAITGPDSGDGCCPSPLLGGNVDADCPSICGNGVLEPGETCDSAIAAGQPGACVGACDAPPLACVRVTLEGTAGACSAACVPTAVSTCSAVSDGCCPTGCTYPADPDCSPTCGNGVVDGEETCDTAIASGAGACPKTCSDGVACTDDLLVNGGTCKALCVFLPTTEFRSGDACCPPGANAAVDPDCPATCGNGVVEPPWETCDTESAPASCTSQCPPTLGCQVFTRMQSNACDARCVLTPVETCVADGCCAPGCNANSDPDCSPRCGNGVLESGEACDHGITAGHLGACASSCDDNDACTLDFSRGSVDSCSRVCSHVPITACSRTADGCCPAGCNRDNDADCFAKCGDNVVQMGETCDPPSSCPTNCPDDNDACTTDQLVGSPETCNAACVHAPVLRCSGSTRDGCCPTECTSATDSDC